MLEMLFSLLVIAVVCIAAAAVVDRRTFVAELLGDDWRGEGNTR